MELQDYKKQFPKLQIEQVTYLQKIEDLEKKVDYYKAENEKLLTSPNNKYDSIELPKLKADEITNSLKLADKFTLQRVVEFIRADYYEFIKNLADNLNKESSYDISIASNVIRRRYEAWIQILSKHANKSENYNDRATGEIKQVKKK